jgi:hypothetical protein
MQKSSQPAINQAAHDFLTSNGYSHQHFEADFDDGDAENGPGFGGSPAYDLYTGELEIIGISETGEADREVRDLERERQEAEFFAGMEGA